MWLILAALRGLQGGRVAALGLPGNGDAISDSRTSR